MTGGRRGGGRHHRRDGRADRVAGGRRGRCDRPSSRRWIGMAGVALLVSAVGVALAVPGRRVPPASAPSAPEDARHQHHSARRADVRLRGGGDRRRRYRPSRPASGAGVRRGSRQRDRDRDGRHSRRYVSHGQRHRRVSRRGAAARGRASAVLLEPLRGDPGAMARGREDAAARWRARSIPIRRRSRATICPSSRCRGRTRWSSASVCRERPVTSITCRARPSGSTRRAPAPAPRSRSATRSRRRSRATTRPSRTAPVRAVPAPTQTSPVGSFGVANAFGLADMHGNVSEWCLGEYHPSYHGAPGDGRPWVTGGDTDRHVVRGGSWDDLAVDCRSANRYAYPREGRQRTVGFRLAMSLAPSSRGGAVAAAPPPAVGPAPIEKVGADAAPPPAPAELAGAAPVGPGGDEHVDRRRPRWTDRRAAARVLNRRAPRP